MNYLSIFLCVPVLFASYWLGYTPLIIPVIYVVLSVATFLFYAKDKSAAQYGAWRVSESTLHTLSLFGGWPGAILAQQKFRHKTKKIAFRIPFWITVIANAGALAWLHTGIGAVYLNTYIFKVEDIIVKAMSNGTAQGILLNLLSFHA